MLNTKTKLQPVWSPIASEEIRKEYEAGFPQNEWKRSPVPPPSFPSTKPTAWKSLLRIRDVLIHDFERLKPAWLKNTKRRRIHPTSYLDGLRGVASFLVYIHHSSFAFFPAIRPGYGSEYLPPGTVNHNYIIQLPILRLIYSGSAMVAIFFVISGAVLSLKPLRLARDGEHLKLIESLSSSVFRRGPRLYIPCIVVTFFTALASISGLFLTTGITRDYPVSPSRNWVEQFRVWTWSTIQFVSPYAHGTIWEQNLWTIPVEFRGSMMVFLCVLGVAKLRSRWMRTLSLVVLNLYWFHLGWWEMFLFLGGMIISELSLYRTEAPRHSAVIKGIHFLLVIIAAYMLSMPERNEGLQDSSFGYGWLWSNFSPASWAKIVPLPGRFWPCFGAVLFVAVQTHAGPDSYYQQVFTTRFIQYLGEISFSFYLWHGLVIYSVGARVFTWMSATVGHEGVWWWIVMLITEAATLPTLFWISDLSTVYVDKAAVRFGRWLTEL